MELHQIRYFLATCETLNFTKAAEASNVTQPALTKALRLLEEELGGPLFDRQSRPLRMTELGRHLRRKFGAVQDLTTEIVAQARLFTSLDSAVYTLGMISTIGDTRFLRLVEAMQRKAPGIALSLRLIPQAHLTTALREGELELAVLVDFDRGAGDFEQIQLFKEDYVLALPADHPLAEKDPVILGDLENIGYVHRTHCELNEKIDQMLSDHRISLSSRLSTDQDAIARMMIRAGLGVSIMPVSLCDSATQYRSIDGARLSRTVSLAYLKDRSLSASAETIKDVIVDIAVGRA